MKLPIAVALLTAGPLAAQWPVQLTVQVPSPHPGANYGYVVRVDGDTALVTSPRSPGGGKAFVLTRSGGTWTLADLNNLQCIVISTVGFLDTDYCSEIDCVVYFTGAAVNYRRRINRQLMLMGE